MQWQKWGGQKGELDGWEEGMWWQVHGSTCCQRKLMWAICHLKLSNSCIQNSTDEIMFNNTLPQYIQSNVILTYNWYRNILVFIPFLTNKSLKSGMYLRLKAHPNLTSYIFKNLVVTLAGELGYHIEQWIIRKFIELTKYI